MKQRLASVASNRRNKTLADESVELPDDIDRKIVSSRRASLAETEETLSCHDFNDSFHWMMVQHLKNKQSSRRTSKIGLRKKKPDDQEQLRYMFPSDDTYFELADERCWADQLVYSLDGVKEQVNCGNESLKSLSVFFQKYVKLQKTFADDLHKIASKELSKLDCTNEPDNLDSLWQSMLNMFNQVLIIGEGHRSHAQKVEENVLGLLKNVSQKNSEGMKQALEVEKELNSSADAQIKKLLKRRQKCEKALSELNDRSIASKLAQNLKVSKQDAVIKAYSSCVKYREAIDKSNSHLAHIDTLGIPPILMEVQAMEQYRHIMTQTAFNQFVALFNPLRECYQNSQQQMINSTQAMHLKKDIETFASRCPQSVDISSRKFKYDLPMDLPDIIELADAKQRTQLKLGTFLNVSVRAEMNSQKASHPTLQAPLTFVRLISSFQQLDGFTKEGIFRISAEQRQLEQFIEQVKSKDEFTLQITDAHIAAVALKQWLREIEEPLIPEMYYKECISLGNQDCSDPKTLSKVLELVPGPNRAMIFALTRMVRKISSEENVKLTKMSIPNLAVVFAPGLLRSDSAVHDIASFMEVSKGSIAFVTNLFKYIEINEQLINWENLFTNKKLFSPLQTAKEELELSESDSATNGLVNSSDPWEEYLDEASGEPFFYNRKTGLSQWESPVIE